MPTSQKKVKIGTLVKIEEGSYYCQNAERYVSISFCTIGMVIDVFYYNSDSYPWVALGYEYLADVIMGPHKLRDIPNFKIYEVNIEKNKENKNES